MVQCKVLKQLSILEQKRSDDEDIMGDVEFLNERLQSSVQDLSSFDQYATEVKSGRYVFCTCFSFLDGTTAEFFDIWFRPDGIFIQLMVYFMLVREITKFGKILLM